MTIRQRAEENFLHEMKRINRILISNESIWFGKDHTLYMLLMFADNSIYTPSGSLWQIMASTILSDNRIHNHKVQYVDNFILKMVNKHYGWKINKIE